MEQLRPDYENHVLNLELFKSQHECEREIKTLNIRFPSEIKFVIQLENFQNVQNGKVIISVKCIKFYIAWC